MKKIIIIGATSGIGRGLAEVYSQEDYPSISFRDWLAANLSTATISEFTW